MPTTSAPRAGRGRRPAADVRRAALTAAADLLFQQGIDAVTHERVAALAGVSKTTLYKWWPSRGVLAADAYFDRSAPVLVMPDTGVIEADLKTQVRRFVELMTQTDAGRAVRGLIAAAQSDDAVRAAFAERYVQPRRKLGGEALERARSRGQLRADIDTQVLVDQIWGACYYRLLTEPHTVTPDYADRLVEQCLRAAAPQAAADPEQGDAATSGDERGPL